MIGAKINRQVWLFPSSTTCQNDKLRGDDKFFSQHFTWLTLCHDKCVGKRALTMGPMGQPKISSILPWISPFFSSNGQGFLDLLDHLFGSGFLAPIVVVVRSFSYLWSTIKPTLDFSFEPSSDSINGIMTCRAKELSDFWQRFSILAHWEERAKKHTLFFSRWVDGTKAEAENTLEKAWISRCSNWWAGEFIWGTRPTQPLQCLKFSWVSTRRSLSWSMDEPEITLHPNLAWVARAL